MTPQERYRKRHPELYRAAASKHYYKDHEKHKREARDHQRRMSYGRDAVEYFEARKKKQRNRCAICGRPPDGRWKKLNQDHDKRTKKKRGLLCCSCNMGLGRFKESRRLLLKALKYLRKWE